MGMVGCCIRCTQTNTKPPIHMQSAPPLPLFTRPRSRQALTLPLQTQPIPSHTHPPTHHSSLYFAVITLATVGYGDLHAYSPVEAGFMVAIVFFNASRLLLSCYLGL